MDSETAKFADGSDRLDELVRREFDNLRAKQEPWVDVPAWDDFLAANNVGRTKGDRHNWTDGEWHEVLIIRSERYELHANSWEINSGWESAIRWVLSNTPNHLEQNNGETTYEN